MAACAKRAPATRPSPKRAPPAMPPKRPPPPMPPPCIPPPIPPPNPPPWPPPPPPWPPPPPPPPRANAGDTSARAALSAPAMRQLRTLLFIPISSVVELLRRLPPQQENDQEN